MPDSNLTLYDIESALSDLVAARDEVTDPEEIKAVEAALAEYVGREISKVDSIRGFLKHGERMAAAAREEARVQAERARRWDAQVARLKLATALVMEQRGLKRLEGRAGVLMLKGNGGEAPLAVQSEELVPDEYCDYVGRVPARLWRTMVTMYLGYFRQFGEAEMRMADMKRQVNNARVREGLGRKEEIPGAHLEERKSHLEVK